MQVRPEREPWIDALKGVAIILVVLGHVLDGATGQGLFSNDAWMEKLHAFIYIFHMPLFFLLSGAAFAKSLESRERTIPGGYWSRCLNLLLIYVFWSALMYGSKRILSAEASVVYEEPLLYCLLFAPVDPYWYLIVLMYYYILSLFLGDGWKSRLGMRRLFIGSFVISGLLPTIQSVLPGRTVYFIYRILYHYVYFVLGILIIKYKAIFRKDLTSFYWLLIPLFTLFIGVFCYDGLLIYPFIRECVALSIICGLLLWFLHDSVWENHSVINWVGQNSIYIYLMHNYITVLIRVLYKKAGIVIPSGIYVIVCLTAAMLICIFICFVVKKIWILDVFFQPVKTAKKIQEELTKA